MVARSAVDEKRGNRCLVLAVFSQSFSSSCCASLASQVSPVAVTAARATRKLPLPKSAAKRKAASTGWKRKNSGGSKKRFRKFARARRTATAIQLCHQLRAVAVATRPRRPNEPLAAAAWKLAQPPLASSRPTSAPNTNRKSVQGQARSTRTAPPMTSCTKCLAPRRRTSARGPSARGFTFRDPDQGAFDALVTGPGVGSRSGRGPLAGSIGCLPSPNGHGRHRRRNVLPAVARHPGLALSKRQLYGLLTRAHQPDGVVLPGWLGVRLRMPARTHPGRRLIHQRRPQVLQLTRVLAARVLITRAEDAAEFEGDY